MVVLFLTKKGNKLNILSALQLQLAGTKPHRHDNHSVNNGGYNNIIITIFY